MKVDRPFGPTELSHRARLAADGLRAEHRPELADFLDELADELELLPRAFATFLHGRLGDAVELDLLFAIPENTREYFGEVLGRIEAKARRGP